MPPNFLLIHLPFGGHVQEAMFLTYFHHPAGPRQRPVSSVTAFFCKSWVVQWSYLYWEIITWIFIHKTAHRMMNWISESKFPHRLCSEGGVYCIEQPVIGFVWPPTHFYLASHDGLGRAPVHGSSVYIPNFLSSPKNICWFRFR